MDGPSRPPPALELFDHAPVGLWIAGPDGSRTYFNRRWITFTGRRLEDEAGNGWTAGLHPEDLERCLGTYFEAVKARREYELEYRLRRADGEYRWVQDAGAPHYGGGGELVAYVGSMVDVAEAKRAELERESALAEAQAANRAKDQFLATLSHELRTPLNAVVGWADMLRSGSLDAATTERAIDSIDRNARAHSQLISDLLDVSRIVSGKLSLDVRPVDVAPAVEAGVIPTAETGAGAPLAPRLEGVSVLVVDDDADARHLITTLLEERGTRVTAVASAAEAMAELARARPDVLLSDIEMPGEDGCALIRRIRALPPEQGGRVPAAALTAHARMEDRMQALLAGFHLHLPKPVQPAELAAVVASLARRAW